MPLAATWWAPKPGCTWRVLRLYVQPPPKRDAPNKPALTQLARPVRDAQCQSLPLLEIREEGAQQKAGKDGHFPENHSEMLGAIEDNGLRIHRRHFVILLTRAASPKVIDHSTIPKALRKTFIPRMHCKHIIGRNLSSTIKTHWIGKTQRNPNRTILAWSTCSTSWFPYKLSPRLC